MARFDKNKIHQAAQRYVAKGQLEKALGQYQLILNEDEDDTVARFKTAEVFERLGKKQEAIAEYQRVANAFTAAGFLLKGIAVLKRILAIDPKQSDVHMELAEDHQKLGKIFESVMHYQNAAKLKDPESEKIQSIDILKKIVDLGPPNREKRLEVATLYYKENYTETGYEQFCHATSDLDSASDELEEVTIRMCKAFPGDTRLRLRLGEIYLARNEPKIAGEILEGVTRTQRTGFTVELLAQAKFQTDFEEEAKSLFEEAAKRYEGEGNHAKKRELAARLREFEASEVDEVQADTKGSLPQNSLEGGAATSSALPGGGREEGVAEERRLDSALARADTYLSRDDQARAIAILEELVQTYPHRTDPLFRLRWIYEESGDWAGVADLSRRLATRMVESGDSERAARFTSEANAAEARAKETGSAHRVSRSAQPRPQEAPSEVADTRTAAGPSTRDRDKIEVEIKYPAPTESAEPMSNGAKAPRPSSETVQIPGEDASANSRILRERQLRQLVDRAGDSSNKRLMEKTVLSTAFRHAVTGLPIRGLFMDRLEAAIKQGKEDDGFQFALLALDLDRFKNINDSLGHALGDELLVAIARRIEECVDEGSTGTYLGGDEFIILLENIRGTTEAIKVAEKIQEKLTASFNLDGREVFTSAGIGIAMGSTGYDHAQDLMRDADTAMYRAKARGKARYELFDKKMRERAVTVLKLETDLRRAIDRGEFRVHYQPIIALERGRIAGFEGLVRWLHPDGNLVPPKDFIPIAEEIDLIIPIDTWVLMQSCRQLALWQQRHRRTPPLTMNANLSGKHFARPDLIAHIEQVLKETGIDPRTLKLEITESVVMENINSASTMLGQLKALNVQLNIDDFGTGHSSLASLHRYPFDTLKIDRSFVRGMETNPENSGIIQTIISLARNLSMSVVAEGIETAEQLASLRDLGCDYGQGFLFCEPVDVTAAEALLENNPQW